ncbi:MULTISPECIES: Bcr/CflA family multidrug efflux MFS transporter [Caldilinea]|uniref:Putative drug resistance transporter n=1 Tax=Caldilinea aerophila (strain DSM 14535 / JCM 11387 / NBRC 104270 / STL-6-O1) TaxID=926550 RepID=I0I423_CALAS|nr:MULTISPECIES: Bcr/CflA family multidrug efflux MFS transporter [Caldilinea]MBO9392314.1 Bcr/CflA family multidrug efflux MFS transporter [Caldilinea sp.]BAM00011.1 putative drug resistance transporter [Caldilinea aerophila DSM 14535 = NBRC 104270]GIV73322.1 MAG: Bcr/CflA family drug resistance efflux transporter [Caldilinea sp.]
MKQATASTVLTARPSYTRLALILGTLAAFGPFSIDMYLPALPTIAAEFGVTTAAIQQTLSVFFIGLAIGQLFYGPISDRVGRRAPLLFGCGLYTVASIGCALAPSAGGLMVLRFLQALGGAVGMVIGRSVVRDCFEEREAARMFSLLMLVMGVAPITAPLLGGQVLIVLGWRAIFFFLAAFGLFCLLMVWFGLEESLPTGRRTREGLGYALRAYGGLLTDRRYMGFALAGGLASAAMFAYISGSAFVFIELNNVPPDRFGFFFGANAFGLIAASQLNRWLLRRFTAAQLLSAALSVTAGAALLLFVVTLLNIGGFPLFVALLFITIGSTGMVGPNAMALALAPYGRKAGSASAVLGATQFAVGALAGALVGLLANGTALPMVGVIALCGAGAWMLLHFLTHPARTTRSATGP